MTEKRTTEKRIKDVDIKIVDAIGKLVELPEKEGGERIHLLPMQMVIDQCIKSEVTSIEDNQLEGIKEQAAKENIDITDLLKVFRAKIELPPYIQQTYDDRYRKAMEEGSLKVCGRIYAKQNDRPAQPVPQAFVDTFDFDNIDLEHVIRRQLDPLVHLLFLNPAELDLELRKERKWLNSMYTGSHKVTAGLLVFPLGYSCQFHWYHNIIGEVRSWGHSVGRLEAFVRSNPDCEKLVEEIGRFKDQRHRILYILQQLGGFQPPGPVPGPTEESRDVIPMKKKDQKLI